MFVRSYWASTRRFRYQVIPYRAPFSISIAIFPNDSGLPRP